MKNGHQNNKRSLNNILNTLFKLKEKNRSKISLGNINVESKKIRSLHLYFIGICGIITGISIQTNLGISQLLSGILISTLLVFLFYRDIVRYKPSYLKKYNMLILLASLLIGTLLIGRLFSYLLINLSKGFEYKYVDTALFGIPIPVGAMLVSLLFDFHTAITFSFIVSILSGLWLNDVFFTFYLFVGSITAAFGVIRCKKRTQIIKGGSLIIAINITTVILILMFKGQIFSAKLFPSIIFAIIGGFSVTAVISLLLPLIEYTFKVTTDISLLELLDLDQPLMRSLMINAPGTYHHSVIVGNLVEAAAEAVGANPLLARVSAYYHDIGKIKMPEYFVENQSSSISKHDKLTPHMSSLIIINHVKEGVELAKQYKLPSPIIDVIAQHHGTMLISYFYQKAKEHSNLNIPSEEDYRYPGPKPQTRVAALVMMADAVEAASKVLSDPTPARISSLVDRIINHIFLEGQLDECELTLKDIQEVKKRFSYILTGIFHKRIDYPGFDFNDENLNKEPTKINKNKSKEDNKPFKEKSSVPIAF